MATAPAFDWERQPDAEALLRAEIGRRLDRVPNAQLYADRLLASCGVRLRDIVDHLTFDDDRTPGLIEAEGWEPRGDGVWENPQGWFPAFVRCPGETGLWFRVESIEQLLRATGVDAAVEGAAHGPYRRTALFRGESAVVGGVERNGHLGYDVPETDAALIREARLTLQRFRARRREFDSVAQGLDHTEALVDQAVAAIGPHRACDLWLKAEREYWMKRCPAGRLQKARQDAAGIGWSNIDHHTYDGSREHFMRTVRILEKLGYELREMLYAGAMAGWGSQILEQPAIRSTIFADVDLAPEEVDIDFAHQPLPPLDRHRRAGVLSVMHGESILEGGLNHVAGLYEQRTLRSQLEGEGLKMMQPFSDFPHLYQELTEGDWAAVDPARVDLLVAGRHMSEEEGEKVRLNGAIAAHLENIERNDGYKGFNKPGIDGVLRKLDPRRYEDA
jgi:hypothetical protein